jgi:hypothetical protein
MRGVCWIADVLLVCMGLRMCGFLARFFVMGFLGLRCCMWGL